LVVGCWLLANKENRPMNISVENTSEEKENRRCCLSSASSAHVFFEDWILKKFSSD